MEVEERLSWFSECSNGCGQVDEIDEGSNVVSWSCFPICVVCVDDDVDVEDSTCDELVREDMPGFEGTWDALEAL